MPTRTDRQLAADALHRAFLVNFIADLESQELDYSSDSEGDDSDDSDDSMDGSDSSSDSSSTSSSLSESSDGGDSDFTSPAETNVHHMGNLYSERYMAEWTEIPKLKCSCSYCWASTRISSLIFSDPTCISIQTVSIHWWKPYKTMRSSITIPTIPRSPLRSKSSLHCFVLVTMGMQLVS